LGRTADAIAEGLQIAWAAARLAVKNLILVETIAGGEDFEPESMAGEAREVLLALATEQEAAAVLVHRQRRKAWGKYTEPGGTHDYRDRDTRNLRKRHKQYVGVAKGLHEYASDHDTVLRLVEEARASAWADVEGNLSRRLAVEGMRADADPEYGAMREARMTAVTMIDLQRLEARQRKLGLLPEAPDLDAANQDAEDDGSPGTQD
jgi:hypothetical protein